MDNSKPTQRPQLFSAPQTGSSGSGGSAGRRILASLENSGKAHAPGALLARMRPSHLVLGLMLLAMLAAAVAGFNFIGMTPAQHNKAFAISQRETPLVTTPQEVERKAAAIVNEPLPAIMPVARKPLQPHVEARALKPLAANTPARPRAAPHSGNAATSARISSAAAQPDSDVALLAALVAHTGGQALGVPAVQASRDVVERKDGDNTDALLLRCQRLGGAEAGMCRARICNGQWLHEAACRAPLSD